MSERKDLTRWNRAGLSSFTYVDGNAVEYLELLRRELAARFTGIDQPGTASPASAASSRRKMIGASGSLEW